MFKSSVLATAFALISIGSVASLAQAQSLDSLVQRNVNQETRIRNGLQDGSLNTREAALLQRDERRVDRFEAEALKNGQLTTGERQRIARAENSASRDIYTARHNDIGGNPLSNSSLRMQRTTQRDINQETRIDNGVKQGLLTNGEVSSLERGQAYVDNREFRAGRDGYAVPQEMSAINRAQNAQDVRIHTDRTNGIRRHI